MGRQIINEGVIQFTLGSHRCYGDKSYEEEWELLGQL